MIGIEKAGKWCIDKMKEKKDEFIKLCRERANKKYNLNYVKQYIKKFCKPYDFVKEGSFIVAYSKY